MKIFESSKPEPKAISSALILAKDLKVEEAPIKSPGAAVCDFSLFSLVRYWVWNFCTLEVLCRSNPDLPNPLCQTLCQTLTPIRRLCRGVLSSGCDRCGTGQSLRAALEYRSEYVH